MDAAELARWTRFAAKGGIGKCTATKDCVAESQEDLMFLKGDEIVVLMHLPEAEGLYLGYCEGVVGRFEGVNVQIHGKLKKPVMTKRLSSTTNRSSITSSNTHHGSPSPGTSVRASLTPRTSRSQPIAADMSNEVLRPPSTSHSSWSPASEPAIFTPIDAQKFRADKDLDASYSALDIGRPEYADGGRVSALTDANNHEQEPSNRYDYASDHSQTTYASDVSAAASMSPTTRSSNYSDMYIKEASTRINDRISTFSDDGEFGIGMSLLQDAGSDIDSDEDGPPTAQPAAFPVPPPLPAMVQSRINAMQSSQPPDERPDSRNSTIQAHGPPPSHGPFRGAAAYQSHSRTNSPDRYFSHSRSSTRTSTRTSDMEASDWEGADDIYDDYRYSRFSLASKISNFSKASVPSKLSGRQDSEDREYGPVPPVPQSQHTGGGAGVGGAGVGHDKSGSVATFQTDQSHGRTDSTVSSKYSVSDGSSFAASDRIEELARSILAPLSDPNMGETTPIASQPPPLQSIAPPAISAVTAPRRVASLHQKAIPPPLKLTSSAVDDPPPTIFSPTQTTAPLRIKPSPIRTANTVTSPLLHTEFTSPTATVSSGGERSPAQSPIVLPIAPSGSASALRAQLEEGRPPSHSPVSSIETPSIDSRLNGFEQSMESGDVHGDSPGSEVQSSPSSFGGGPSPPLSGNANRGTNFEPERGRVFEDDDEDESAEGDGDDTIEGFRQELARDSFVVPPPPDTAMTMQNFRMPMFSSALPSSRAAQEFVIPPKRESAMHIDPEPLPSRSSSAYYPPEAEAQSPASPNNSAGASSPSSSPLSPSYPQQSASPPLDNSSSPVMVPRRSPMSPPPLSASSVSSSPTTQPSVSPQPRANAAQLAAMPRGPSLFLPHPGAPKAPQANAGFAMPLVHARQPSNPSVGPGMGLPPPPPLPIASGSLLNVMRAAAARNFGGPGNPPRRTTIYGKTERDLASAVGPVLIAFSLEPPPNDNAVHKSGNLANIRGPPRRAMTTGPTGLLSIPMPPAFANAGPKQDIKQPQIPAPSVPQDDGGVAGAIPRANFFPQVGKARPRSRSFSGFSSPFPDVPFNGGVSDGEAPGRKGSAPVSETQPQLQSRSQSPLRQSPPQPQPIQRPPRHAPSPLSLPQNDLRRGPPGNMAISQQNSPSRAAFSPSEPSSPSGSPKSPRERALPPSGLRTVVSSSALRGNAAYAADVPPATFMPQHREMIRDGADPSRASADGSTQFVGELQQPRLPPAMAPPRSYSASSQRQRRPSEGSDIAGFGVLSEDARAQMVSPPLGPPYSTSSHSRVPSLRSKLSLSALRPTKGARTGKEASETPSSSAPDTPIDHSNSETVQVQDMDFELVRPTIPGSIVGRMSEDSVRKAPFGESAVNGADPTDAFLRPNSPAGSMASSINARSTVNTDDDRPKPSDIEAHRAREVKWMSIMSALPASQARKNKKVRKLLGEGVPASVRYLVWGHVCDSGARRMPGIYVSLGKRDRVAAADEIERDAVRCFPDHPQLQDPKGPLVSVLHGYLTMQPNMRYQSGLAIMAGTILLQAPEEDAFWIFIAVMDMHMRPYFTPKSAQMDVDASLFFKAIEGLDQALAQKVFTEMGIRPISICGPWFSSLFGLVLPSEHLTRVWDIFLYEGPAFLFRVGLVLFFYIRRGVLEGQHTPPTLLSALHSRPPPSSGFPADPEAFIEAAFSLKFKDDDIRKQRTKMEEQARRQTTLTRPLTGAAISTPRPHTQPIATRF